MFPSHLGAMPGHPPEIYLRHHDGHQGCRSGDPSRPQVLTWIGGFKIACLRFFPRNWWDNHGWWKHHGLFDDGKSRDSPIHLAEWLEMDGLMDGFLVETHCAIETSWWKVLGHAIFSILAERFPARSWVRIWKLFWIIPFLVQEYFIIFHPYHSRWI